MHFEEVTTKTIMLLNLYTHITITNIFFNFILFLNNCISFAKYQNESATGIFKEKRKNLLP